MEKEYSLSIVMPAFNEEDNLESSIKAIGNILEQKKLDWELILINDGSADNTRQVAENLSSSDSRIKILHNQRNMGIGYCFRRGVENAQKDFITWLPADGENDLMEVIKFFPLLEHVDIIVPFVINIGIRPWARRLISAIYLWIINISFGVMFHYTNGNVVYRSDILRAIRQQSNGFFFHAECLVKAVQAGFIFAEVPVRLKKRNHGISKALTLKSFFTVTFEFIKLLITMHIPRRVGRVSKNS